jgi:TolB-like protein/Tfp pilus assembly protein PilF
MSAELRKEIELEIAHVLFIDIVAYSKLSVNEQHAGIEQLNEIVRSSEQFRKAEAARRILKIPTGDGMALVFYKSPEEPARCAFEISRALKDNPRLQIRMGIHSGPVSGVVDVNEQTNVAGAGINIARRVMDCGDAGHILISKHVAEDLENYQRWRPFLHDIGTFEAKHGVRVSITNLYSQVIGNSRLPSKMQAVRKRRAHVRWAKVVAGLLVLAAIIGSTFFYLRGPTAPALRALDKSIAVLPFENLSEDQANAYFAEGIQDEILTRLSKIADLKVISRTSTQHYKSAPKNLPEIARQLGVAHILEGSVQKSGDTVRVNVQLIKAANDSHLWADTFDRKLTDIFFVESDVAKAVADQLRAKLTGREEQVIAGKPTENPEAYDAYLHGLAYALNAVPTAANAIGAQQYLKEAVRLDPKFALSWALLSFVDARSYLSQIFQPTVSLREEARQAAETALSLQPDLGEALLAKGYYHYACLRDYETAKLYFERAHQLLPNSSRVPELLAYLARRQGLWYQSELYFNEAENLDPLNALLLSQHSFSYIFLRQFPAALRKLDQVLKITPDDPNTLVYKAAIAQAEGDLTRASVILAPLHPDAHDEKALETQVYQAMLERQTGQIIPRLNQITSTPDLSLGYVNGELQLWLGLAQEVAGDCAAALATWQRARSELESFVKDQPDNYIVLGDLALANAALGNKEVAFDLANKAAAAIPNAKDAVAGPGTNEILSRVAARFKENDVAIAAIEKLIATPYQNPLAPSVPLTPALLRLDPAFDAIKNDPRFQKLASSNTAAGARR